MFSCLGIALLLLQSPKAAIKGLAGPLLLNTIIQSQCIVVLHTVQKCVFNLGVHCYQLLFELFTTLLGSRLLSVAATLCVIIALPSFFLCFFFVKRMSHH